jgi:hypothetical protein
MEEETQSQTQTPLFVEYEGFLISADGEVVGVVLPDGSYELYAAADESVDPDWRKRVWYPKTESDAEWVMDRRAHIVAKQNAVERQKAEALERMERKSKQLAADLARFDGRFQDSLFEIARANFPKGKKAWISPYGSVEERTTPASVKVADPALALEWAKANYPEAVVQPEAPPASFSIQLLPKDAKKAFIEAPDSVAGTGLSVTPATEKTTIKQ